MDTSNTPEEWERTKAIGSYPTLARVVHFRLEERRVTELEDKRTEVHFDPVDEGDCLTMVKRLDELRRSFPARRYKLIRITTELVDY